MHNRFLSSSDFQGFFTWFYVTAFWTTCFCHKSVSNSNGAIQGESY